MSFKELKSYQQATFIYDLTVELCRKYLDPKSRTNDQMVQAARSGKQHIVEGTAATKTSPITEIRLLGMARASFEELLEDYLDFLRQKGLKVWEGSDPRVVELRRLPYRADTSYETYRTYFEEPEKIANVLITPINQTNYLLDQRIKAVTRQHQQRGEVLESQNQKIARIQYEEQKKNKNFNERLKGFLKKE